MFRVLLALAAVLGLVGVPAAASAGTQDEPGYVRIGHLSPDTAPADVTLTAVSGGTTLYSFDDIPYGGVSMYMQLAPGTYALGMAPAESGSNTPTVTAEVKVTPGMAVTIAALGPNASINLVTIEDALTPPAAGMARARVVQAATTADQVTVRLPDGSDLATDAKFGDVGQYRDVAPGSAALTLVTRKTEGSATVDLRSGAAQTLFVLDDASGALTVLPVVDSATMTETPVGGLATGGGALAMRDAGIRTLAAAGLLAVLAAAGVAAARRARRSGGA